MVAIGCRTTTAVLAKAVLADDERYRGGRGDRGGRGGRGSAPRVSQRRKGKRRGGMG